MSSQARPLVTSGLKQPEINAIKEKIVRHEQSSDWIWIPSLHILLCKITKNISSSLFCHLNCFGKNKSVETKFLHRHYTKNVSAPLIGHLFINYTSSACSVCFSLSLHPSILTSGRGLWVAICPGQVVLCWALLLFLQGLLPGEGAGEVN